MLTLYQFPISHYCEKIRWALDYKNLEYRVKNLLPGLHTLTTKKLTPSSALPILVHDGNVIQNSSTIITYLDENFPEKPLTPTDEILKHEALAWEKCADNEIGIAVRTMCYQVLLDHPSLVIPLFTTNGPWYGSLLLKALFPKLRETMLNKMNINAKTAEIANRQLDSHLDKVVTRLENHHFLVGDQFTRADLSVAALLAPLFRPQQYGLNWPNPFPEPLETTITHHAEKLQLIKKLYGQYR